MRKDTVLFVDDNVLCNLEICEVLRDHGFQVLQTYCAAAAYETLSRRVQLSALVTDIDLGPGPDGFDVARHARAAFPRLPVIFISGAEGPRHKTEGVEQSVFISKPLHGGQIVEALKRAIRLEAA